MRYSCSETFFLLKLLLARAPLVLEILVQRVAVDVLGPPVAPAGEEDAFRVLGEIISKQSTKYV